MIKDLLKSAAPIALVIAISLWKPRLGSRWFHGAERALARLAQRPSLSILSVGLVSFAFSACISLFVAMPHPCGHDEFSYLLAADTFAHGRLTNPTHPLWVHFESFHIIQQPTYASIYPPMQGWLLAVGQLITGLPIMGVWLSHALACMAIYWMLLAWTRPRWALLGGLLAAVHPTMLWWSQIYMGGAVAAGGGALLLGAMRRITKSPQTRDAILMALGMAVLANSRPYEGMVLSLLAGWVLIAWMAGKDAPPVRPMLNRIVLPTFLLLTLIAAAMCHYNARVTGDPLRLPHAAYDAVYATAPPFIWQEPIPVPAYRHKAIRDFHMGLELSNYNFQRTPRGLLFATLKKLRVLVDGFFPVYVFGIPLYWCAIFLPVLPPLLRSRWMRTALLMATGFTAAQLLINWTNVHYAAPIFGLVLALGVQALRLLGVWRPRGRPCGQLLMRAALLLCAASLIPTTVQLSDLAAQKPWHTERARLLAELKRDGQRHLVIVHYGPQHWSEAEWVYNEADIDSAHVVWAREMDEVENRKLIEYFHDRRVWLLEADSEPPHLSPWQPPQRDAVKDADEHDQRPDAGRKRK